MEPAELDNALEELEIRLERLRALYQQYFLGIEKLEPTIARKDVDRRIWTLRKMQIRNTRKRFRLNVIVQRYNTFQQYWIRTCREIEQGTYRQHVLRAQRTVGETEPLTIAARKRLGLGAQRKKKEAAAKAQEAARDLERDLDTALAEKLDPVDDIKRAMDEALGRSAPPSAGPDKEPAQARIPPAPAVPGSGTGISPFDLEFDEGPRTPREPGPSERPSVPGEQGASTPTPVQPEAGKRPVPAPRARLGHEQQPGPSEPAGPWPRGGPSPGPADAPSAGATGLSDQRVKELHAKLLDAKRRTNEPPTVSEKGLAKSLKAAEAKLKKQHGSNRRIDFDIVIKNGKAVVKPIVR